MALEMCHWKIYFHATASEMKDYGIEEKNEQKSPAGLG